MELSVFAEQKFWLFEGPLSTEQSAVAGDVPSALQKLAMALGPFTEQRWFVPWPMIEQVIVDVVRALKAEQTPGAPAPMIGGSAEQARLFAKPTEQRTVPVVPGGSEKAEQRCPLSQCAEQVTGPLLGPTEQRKGFGSGPWSAEQTAMVCGITEDGSTSTGFGAKAPAAASAG